MKETHLYQWRWSRATRKQSLTVAIRWNGKRHVPEHDALPTGQETLHSSSLHITSARSVENVENCSRTCLLLDSQLKPVHHA